MLPLDYHYLLELSARPPCPVYKHSGQPPLSIRRGMKNWSRYGGAGPCQSRQWVSESTTTTYHTDSYSLSVW